MLNTSQGKNDLGRHGCATAGIEDAITRGMDAAEVLNAIMKNVYDADPVKFAEWRTARHVKRSNQANGETPHPPNR